MRMGNLATIGRYQPTNLVHIILDNGVYESTGGQVSASTGVSFCSVAQACGYRIAQRCSTADQLRSVLPALKDERGPSLVHVDIRPGTMARLPRPSIGPAEVALRLRAKIQEIENEKARLAAARRRRRDSADKAGADLAVGA